MSSKHLHGLSMRQHFIKRLFDIAGASIGMLLSGWLILIAYVVASLDTQESGFFMQTRVGRDAKLFKIIKIRTMRTDPGLRTNVTTSVDPRITQSGKVFRILKIDELPQLINVLKGDMSFVGPRPDVPGFADQLVGDDRIVLSVRPGITGPATLRFRDEEELLALQEDPEMYNCNVIFPEKVRLNKEYVQNYSLCKDVKYIWQTIFA